TESRHISFASPSWEGPQRASARPTSDGLVASLHADAPLPALAAQPHRVGLRLLSADLGRCHIAVNLYVGDLQRAGGYPLDGGSIEVDVFVRQKLIRLWGAEETRHPPVVRVIHRVRELLEDAPDLRFVAQGSITSDHEGNRSASDNTHRYADQHPHQPPSALAV